jgi:hypothetical protein
MRGFGDGVEKEGSEWVVEEGEWLGDSWSFDVAELIK